MFNDLHMHKCNLRSGDVQVGEGLREADNHCPDLATIDGDKPSTSSNSQPTILCDNDDKCHGCLSSAFDCPILETSDLDTCLRGQVNNFRDSEMNRER